MIDCETDIFSIVSTALRAEFAGIFVSGEYVPTPPKFPAVSIVEADNRIATRYRTTEIENGAIVMYEVNVYSNKVSGKKAEAKAVAAVLDNEFRKLGFSRTMKNQVPNMNDATIYRIVCRYEGVIIPNDDGKYYVYTN